MNATPTPSYFPQEPKKKNLLPLWITLGTVAVILLIAIIIGSVLSAVNGGSANPAGNRYVGVLHIEGTISAEESTGLLYQSASAYNHDYVLTSIKNMEEDSRNEGILLYLNTPGGEMYATDELYTALTQYKERTGRPVYAYFAQSACSGGYYTAMAADKIYAGRMSTTGSIGVRYSTMFDLSGLCEKLGIKAEDLASGENKAMGGYFTPLTEEQREILRVQLAEAQDYFVEVVVKGRNLTEEKVRLLADGRTYTAKQALENGLIDEIATYEQCKESVTSVIGKAGLSFLDFEYVPDYNDMLQYLSGIAAEGDLGELYGAIAALRPMSGILAYCPVP